MGWPSSPQPPSIGHHTGTTRLCQLTPAPNPAPSPAAKAAWPCPNGSSFLPGSALPPIIKTIVKYFIICSNYPQIIKHWQPVARPPRREGEEVSWGKRCTESLQTPKGCRMRLEPDTGTHPHHPNPQHWGTATQQGSTPQYQGKRGPSPAGETPEQILSLPILPSHFPKPFPLAFWDPDLPHWCSTCHLGEVKTAFQLTGAFCCLD